MWLESSSINAVNLVKKFATVPEISNFSQGITFFGAPCSFTFLSIHFVLLSHSFQFVTHWFLVYFVSSFFFFPFLLCFFFLLIFAHVLDKLDSCVETTLSRIYRWRKRYSNILSNNFRKLKHIVVIFAKQHQRSKDKLTVRRSSTSTNQCCYFTLQNEALSQPLHNNTNTGQNSAKKKQKSVSVQCSSCLQQQ